MENKWYNKTWIVVVALILFAPVGIYAIYKNTNFSSSTKKILYVIVGIFFINLIIEAQEIREKGFIIYKEAWDKGQADAKRL